MVFNCFYRLSWVDMNLRDLEYLVALQELKHFRKAAEKCFVSQPTLSGQIRKLEDELDVILIERTSRKVLFTPAGDQIADQARRVLLESKAIKEIAKSYASPTAGAIHIGLIPTVAPYLLPLIVPSMKKQFPDLDMFLHENQTHELLKQLDEGELDCLLLAYLPGMEKYGHIELYKEPLELIIPSSHRFKGRERVDLSELRGEHVLMLEDGHCLRDQAMDYCFTAGAEEDQSFKATSLETLRHMIAAEAGVTLLPHLAIPRTRFTEGVEYIKFVEPEPTRKIVLLYRKGSVRRPCFNDIAQLINKKVTATIV
ncbi:MAG: LysR family hydrogen peroxide-inducible transcriptional activator [Moritella dasanensis]